MYAFLFAGSCKAVELEVLSTLNRLFPFPVLFDLEHISVLRRPVALCHAFVLVFALL